MKNTLKNASVFGIVLIFIFSALSPVVSLQAKNIVNILFSEKINIEDQLPSGGKENILNQNTNQLSDNPDPIPLDISDPWWNNNWQYRKEITINHSKVDEDLLNFPILIKLESDSNLSSNAQTDGDDIAFTDINGVQLSHEIELFNGSTGQLIAWVKVPSLSSSVDTTLYLYYSNPDVSSQQNPSGVWDSDYVMVQHLNETGNNFYDSTSYNNNGTNTGTVFNENCQVDGGRQYNDDDYISVNGFTYTPTALTAEAWIYRDSTTFINIFCKGGHFDSSDWILYLRTASTTEGIDFGINNHGSYIRKASTPVNTWFYLTAAYQSGSPGFVTFYVNGTIVGGGSISGTMTNSHANLGLGNDNDAGQPWADGRLDELRVSKVNRSAGWISTSFNTMSSPSTFFSLGPEEIGFIPEEPIITNPSPANGTTYVPISLSELNFTLSDYQSDLMDYYVETNPNIGYGNGTGVNNGTYSVSISGLDYLTLYTWYVNVTDPGGSGNWTNVSYQFTTLPEDLVPPVITHNFAGNLEDNGGPHYIPGTSIVASDGYYTNDSHQVEDWIYINCTVTDNVEVEEVWLHWLNETNWNNNTYEFTQVGDNYYEINMSTNISSGYRYSFDIFARDTSGNTDLYQWFKAGDDTTVVDDRRFVQLDGTPADISYTPLYLYPADYSYTTGYGSGHNPSNDDTLHHDQGPDGTLTDTGYLLVQTPSDTMEIRQCGMYVGYWYDDTITAIPGTLDNIYQHVWWHTDNDEITFAYGKYDGGFYRDQNWGQSYATNISYSYSNISYGGRTYYLESALMNIDSPLTYTDNDIYEFFVEHYTPKESPKNPWVINNRSVMSFVIFNVPDNATLQGQDTDGDGLNDYYELYITFTNPFIIDTDNDGVSDYIEFFFGSDPNNFNDVTEVLVPILAMESPVSGSFGQPINPLLSITCTHPLGKTMNVTFRTNATGSWIDIGSNLSVSNGTYSQSSSNMESYDTVYWWSVNCSDGTFWTNETYWFRTISDEPFVSNPIPANGAINIPVSLTQLQFTLTDYQGDTMNYTVETSPDIGVDSGSGVSNGTYSVSISGLSFDTTYNWYVNVTDPFGSNNWNNVTFQFTTSVYESIPPTITHTFAGNPDDSGGPHYLPGTSNVASEGYYTTYSHQEEDWIYITCEVTDNVGIDKVWLQWLNGSSWINDTYEFINIGGNTYEINMTDNIDSGYLYSFDIEAIDSSGNSAVYKWMKIGSDTTAVDDRRYVQLDGTPTDISYTPLYLYSADYDYVSGYGGSHNWLFDDTLHHDQGPDGTLTDTGYLLAQFPADVVNVRQCVMYVGYWFDETVTAIPKNLNNIYQHVWWYSDNEQITFAYGKYDGGLYRDTNWGQSYITSSSLSRSNVSYSGRLYRLESALMNITSPFSYTDNDIYEFFVEYYTPKEDPQAPWVINNRSIMSFVIFNVPDNTTLQGLDTDGDGLVDYDELYTTFTNPFVVDTDNDGMSDYTEIIAGSDPNDYTDVTSVIWPVITMESPINGSSGISFNPLLSVNVHHPLGNIMNLTFRSNASGSWANIGMNYSISDGVYSQISNNIDTFDKIYWWSVNCSDGLFWTNETYWFRTLSDKPVILNPVPADDVIDISPDLTNLTFTLIDYQGDTIDYIVTTSPNIGSGSNTGVGNGTYNISVSGLNFNINYQWFVNVTDPLGSGKWTNKTFNFTTRPKILITNPTPSDGAENVSRHPTLQVTINDWNNNDIEWWIKTNASGVWTIITNGTLINGNGTVSAYIYNQLEFDKKYWWRVEVTDMIEWSNQTYSFTTYTDYQFPIKWTSNIGSNYRGVRTIDLNGDGIKDIVVAVNNGLRALNGTDGSLLWYTPISGVDYAAAIECGDLNNDGIPEVVCDVRSPPVGICAVHGNNGSIYWIRRDFVGGINQACPLILDYNNDGYPYVFSATRDPGPGSLNRVSYDGTQELSVPFTHQCAGGIVGGDCDNDGHFEIYTGNWDPGGMRCYWAENLTLRWDVHYPVAGYAYATSAGEPVLVDYNNDGYKEVFCYIIRVNDGDPDTADDVTTGYALLSCIDGSIVSTNYNISGMSEHYWTYNQVIYDFDHDGHMDWVVGNRHFIIYDLITQTVDHYGSANAERWSPIVADLTGDGVMDVAISFGSYLQVYDKDYNNIARIPKTGYLPGGGTIRNPHATDLDGDGLNEIIIDRGDSAGTISVIETDGIAKFGGSNAGELGYSMYRQGVSEYVSIINLKNEQPARNSINIGYNPNLSVQIENLQDELMDVTFRTNASGTWQNIGGYYGVGDGTYNITPLFMYEPDKFYWWSVNVTDRMNTWNNMTYMFKTIAGTPVAPVISNPNPSDDSIGVSTSISNLVFNLSDYQGDLMNYTVETNPFVGNGSGNNVNNGTYSMSIINPLSYDTIYTWYVNCTDGTYQTRVIFTFRTATSEPVLSSEFPSDRATKVIINPTLKITITDWQGDVVNWQIRSNASGSWTTINSGTLLTGNGTISTPIINMNQYNTKYWWSVNVTDPGGSGNWTNATYSFTTKIQPGPWWNNNWLYRKDIYINHSLVSEDLSNFPIVLNIDDVDLGAHAQTDGDDIVFTDYNGNLLNHQIEKYVNNPGRLVAWVNVTNLSSSSDSLIYIYYGNPDCGPQENPIDTWDSNYLGIWHLNENTGTLYDTTSNNYDGTNHGAIYLAEAKIDGGYDLTPNDYISVNDAQPLRLNYTNFTLEGWVYSDNTATSGFITKYFGTNPWIGWGLDVPGSGGKAASFWSNNQGAWVGSNRLTLPINQWNHITMTFEEKGTTDEINFYFNGVYDSTKTCQNPEDGTATMVFGAEEQGNGVYLDGKIDEIRISNIARSQDWITTTYNTANYPSIFISMGYEEQAELEAPIISDPIPINSATNIPISLSHLFFNLTDEQGDTMNYTVVTIPNIGFGNGNDVTNGTYNISISGLSYDTYYIWMVNVTDSNYWTNETYSFTTEPAPVNNSPVISNLIPENGANNVSIDLPQLTFSLNDPEGDLMNYNVETSPLIGSKVENGVGNGTKTVSISGLNYSTTYYWFINATDPSGSGSWTNQTYSFTTISQPGVHKFTVDSNSHNTYGLAYPVSYIFNIPPGVTGLKAYKFSPGSNWMQIPEKNASDIFSGVEAVRFNYSENKAYVSASFSSDYDDIFIMITNADGDIITAQYQGIAQYYDNRSVAVVITGDDWLTCPICSNPDSTNYEFKKVMDACQERNIWFTPAINSNGTLETGWYPNPDYGPNWTIVQQEIDEGFVELGSHSRNHPHTPYDGSEGDDGYDEEIGGSKQDILENVTMNSLNKKGDEEYLYAWIQPYGQSDATVRQKLGQYKYLCDRSTASGVKSFAAWDSTNGLYYPAGYTIVWDSSSTATLNSAFDSVYNTGGIYHLFGHPFQLNFDPSSHVYQHLNYIANRSGVWYAGFGHLYVYHYMEDQNVINHTVTFGNQTPLLSLESPINGATDVPVGFVNLQINATDPEGDSMNIYFRTNKTGSWTDIGTNISVGSGIYQQSYLFESYATTYWWSVNATDPSGSGNWTNNTYSFTTAPEPVNDSPVISNPYPLNGQFGISISLSQLSLTLNDPEGDSMNYTIETVPNIGSKSENYVGNGTKTVDISGLEYLTTYYWFVNATDPNGSGNWTRSTFSFTTQAEPGLWWNNNWLYRKEIVINHSYIEHDLTNFPVLIYINDYGDSDLVAHAQTDGDDFVFTDYYGIKLNHEIEKYNGTVGKLISWVNVTYLSSTQDTILYMYYGNPGSGNQENITDVWDTNYHMVQHLSETSGTHFDSTVYGNDGTSYNGTIMGTNGIIDGADNFDGTDDFVEVADNASLDLTTAFTLEGWINSDIPQSGTLNIQPFNKPDCYVYSYYHSNPTYSGSAAMKSDTTWYSSGGPITISEGTWHYIVAIYDGAYLRTYVDGIEKSSNNIGSVPIATNDWGFLIGGGRSTSGYMSFFNGLIDEVRVSSIPRNSTWVNTSCQMVSSASTFLSVGSEETSPFEIAWDVLLNFIGPAGVNDTLTFGEASDASDGLDSYDVPKPGAPPAPYVYAWFDENLSEPYDKLMKDYKYYPDNSKEWDIYVYFEDSGSANITISWQPANLTTEYNNVTLKDVDLNVTTDMLINNNYTYVASSYTIHHFQIICTGAPIEYNYKVTLNNQWNLISLPVNQSFNKDNITINYLGTNYTWQQAVSNSIIVSFIYGWNTTIQNYETTDVLAPGNGFWIYAYHDCDLWITSNVSNNDDYITNLFVLWNLIGLPYDTPIIKDNITVYYNGTNYTWQQAVSNSIIVSFIYGWNTTIQNYVTTDVLAPGNGFWIYAYQECILKKE